MAIGSGSYFTGTRMKMKYLLEITPGSNKSKPLGSQSSRIVTRIQILEVRTQLFATVSGGKTAPDVNLGSATSVLEFWLGEKFRAETQMIKESLFRKSQR